MTNYKISIEGVVKTEILYIIGYERFLDYNKDFSEIMKQDFQKLNEYSNKVKVTAPALTVYKSINQEAMYLSTLHAIPVEPTEEAAKECIKIIEEKGIWAVIPSYNSVLKLTLDGSYNHLKEAWGKACEFIKENKLIQDAYASPWESYKVHLGETNGDDSKLVTEIFIPLISMGKEE